MLAYLVGLLIAAGASGPPPDSTAAAHADSAHAGSARADSTNADSTLAAVGDTLALRLRELQVIASDQPGPGRVVQPAGVALDAFGRVYVADAALHRLQRFDASGRWLGESGTLGSGDGELRKPGAVALLGTLSVAVLDRENRRVVSYDLFGRLLGVFATLDDPSLGLGRVDPLALAADGGGAVVVADAERDRLLVFDFSGRFVRTLGGIGAKPGSFRGLAGVAMTRKGDVIVAERANARIQRLDPGGRPVAAWPLAVRPGRQPVALAVDDSARVAVADAESGRVWIYAPTGRLLARLDGAHGPSAVAFARDGSLLVAETAPGRVRRFALEAARAASPAAKE